MPENSSLCCVFCYRDNYYKYDVGTLSNYSWSGEKLWNHTLAYNGVDGIFEKFWRKRDNLIRNAMIPMRADLQLKEVQKTFTHNNAQSDSKKSVIHNFRVKVCAWRKKIHNLAFCILLNTKNQFPLPEQNPIIFHSGYINGKLNHKKSNTVAKHFIYKTSRTTFYPLHPTSAQYSAGGKYHQKSI